MQGREELIEKAVERFYDIRDLLGDRPGSRPPGTSEFLEFLTALLNRPATKVMQELDNLAERLPLLSTLLKSRADQEFYREEMG